MENFCAVANGRGDLTRDEKFWRSSEQLGDTWRNGRLSSTVSKPE
jgi:hypothetical protein